MKNIKSSGLQVVGVSYDKQDVLKKFTKKKGIQFPLLSDPKSEVIKKFQLLNTSGRKGTRYHLISYPMTVILDKNGAVKAKIPATVRRRHDGKYLIKTWKELKK